MAILLSPATSYRYQSNSKACPCPFPNSSFSIPCTSLLLTQRFPTNRVLSYPLHARRPSLSLPSSTGRCLAANSEPPPPPPESDPPPGLARVTESTLFSKLWDWNQTKSRFWL
ncbi:hypothetical protein FNV43_RR06973 [Rhamnella rubrinervis]|uniref:Uncharacterized protein n=1 Tax=Rhamnella rubrinervis TaxID=2594499 RepID=A0A8K0HFL2_9ROSA|nr:hypothetical protein FNV43_RR06973 [Rhamnella rubrinervis]